ncbi:MAG: HupE/UreJ family protein [Pseudomonadota bacterium]|nr:HupE/UreJ family protein [Pseudomonadota bacterium]
MKRWQMILFSLLLLLTNFTPAFAHFSEGTKVRTLLVSREGDTLTVYVRVPAPLVFSDLVGRSQVEQVPLVSPFLRLEQTPDSERYRVDLGAIDSNRSAFEDRLRNALVFSQAGLALPVEIIGFAVHTSRPDQDIDTAVAAQSALSEAFPNEDPLFGTAVIDYALRLESSDPTGVLQVQSGYAPLIPGPGIAIDNHLIDTRITPPVSTTAPGQLEEPARFDGSRLSTFLHFIHQGTLHILEGLDHVFLVIALALGVGATRRLIYLVTAFTIGHSVTLIATFLGATPSWPWFIPLVETAIAASVLYAAIAAMVRKSGSVIVFAAIGLLHGLGFSFVLADILGRGAPDLIPALLAFNIGIEFGQLIILAVTLSIVLFLRKTAEPALQPLRLGALSGIAILSTWWVIERLPGLLTSA